MNLSMPQTSRPFRTWLKTLPPHTAFYALRPSECPLARWIGTRVPADTCVSIGGWDYSVNGKDFKFPNWMTVEQTYIFDASRGANNRRITAAKLLKHLETV